MWGCIAPHFFVFSYGSTLTMNDNSSAWYIVKQQDATCKIIEVDPSTPPTIEPHWGPFENQQQAIAKRVGLIRAGKCQPQ